MSVRPPTVSDLALIKDSWLESYRHAYHVKGVSAQTYRHCHRRVVERLLSRSAVLIACDTKDPWIVWGWCCYQWDGSVLLWHYSYTKDGFRGFDVATQLFAQAVGSRCPSAVLYSHDTKAARRFAKGLETAGVLTVPYLYNPYIMHEGS